MSTPIELVFMVKAIQLKVAKAIKFEEVIMVLLVFVLLVKV